VGGEGRVLGTWVLGGPGEADLRAVDAIARLALMARRTGASLVLAETRAELVELIELVGLRVEVIGKAESGEEAFRVEQREEEAHGGDPSV
jgi:hypothetical protein